MKVIDAQPKPAESEKDWQKTQYSNLSRYVPSGTYYARLRVKGKLIRRSLKTDDLTVAKLRLSDFEKHERQQSEASDGAARGRITVANAVEIFRQRKAGDASSLVNTVGIRGGRRTRTKFPASMDRCKTSRCKNSNALSA